MSSAEPAEGRSFRPLFERWARRVRARLALRHVLTGAAVGLVVGAGASAALWQTRHGALRPLGAAAGLLGAAAGLGIARRRRFSDGDIALYLDARLHADETIATAVELDGKPDHGDDSARAVVISQATVALAKATPKAVRAPLYRPWHAALPIAAAAIGWISFAPLPPAPIKPGAGPGADKVQLARVEGLEKIIALAEMNARDDAQRERLKKLSEDAKKLRDKLKDGAEKREALADLAKIKDGLQAEKLSLGDGQERQGLESALGKLSANPDLKEAQKALGDRDLVSLDDEMEKLANKLEKTDRDRAQKTLEEAAEAAKKNGAPGVAKALEEQKKRLAEQGKKADKLRELAKELGDALGEDGKEAARDFNQKGGGKEEQRLAEKLNEALGKLSPEERKKLAENMKKKLKDEPDSDLAPQPSKKQKKELADQLDTPEGQKQLEEELRKMAEEPPSSGEEGKRQKGLGEAESGAGEAEQQLGGKTPMPMPMPGPGPGKSGKDKPQAGKGETGNTPGNGPDGSGPPGDHKGVTGVIEGKGVKARATSKINKAPSMPGVVLGRSAGKAGETANLAGQGALGNAAPGELGGIERSDVPEEYREQVGRYFQPK
ncbi:Hypothetical protein A7982_09333 [Minicystis rosea]|nr:Hypothetical protein A7982_09333 [Minicystis rosea]